MKDVLESLFGFWPDGWIRFDRGSSFMRLYSRVLAANEASHEAIVGHFISS